MGTRRMLDIPRVERPREKLARRGVESLSTEELLALIVGSGVKGRSAIGVARELIRKHSEKGLAALKYEDLRSLRGVGEARACSILASIELGKRILGDDERVVIAAPEQAYLEVKDLATHRKEHFVALYLNAKNAVIGRETIAIGGLFSSQVHPRELFEPAVKLAAAGIILAHNHPSGDPEPSLEDLELTRKMQEAAGILGFEILDHLIVGQKGYVSLKERGIVR